MLVVSSLLVLELATVGETIVVRSFSELNTVVTVDVSEEAASLFTTAVDCVDDALVCRSIESV